MDLLTLLSDGFATSLSPFNLMIVILGVTAGLFIGAMPGLGSVNGVAIVLPLTFIVPPASAIILLAAIYYGAMYGGAISSILLGIPGASTAVATTLSIELCVGSHCNIFLAFSMSATRYAGSPGLFPHISMFILPVYF